MCRRRHHPRGVFPGVRSGGVPVGDQRDRWLPPQMPVGSGRGGLPPAASFHSPGCWGNLAPWCPSSPPPPGQRQAETECSSLHGAPGSLKSPPLCSLSITDVGRALQLFCTPVSLTQAPARPSLAGWRWGPGAGAGKAELEERWPAAQVGTGLCLPRGDTRCLPRTASCPAGSTGRASFQR